MKWEDLLWCILYIVGVRERVSSIWGFTRCMWLAHGLTIQNITYIISIYEHHHHLTHVTYEYKHMVDLSLLLVQNLGTPFP